MEWNAASQESLDRLIKGNKEFMEARQNNAYTGEEVRFHLAKEGQRPYACVVCCSDSRVDPMHIFSSGLGEIFVIETAGNVVDNFSVASVEYAAFSLRVPLVVVLAHTQCGAIEAALSDGKKRGYMNKLMKHIRAGFGEEKDPDRCAILNAQHSVETLMTSEVLRERVEKRNLEIITGMYDIESGYVDFDYVEKLNY